MPNKRLLVLALVAATLLKLYLAFFTIGTNDVITFHSFLGNIRQVGGVGAYKLRGVYGDPFNHPPFMIHVLRFLGWISETTPLRFPQILRLPGILADAGSVWIVYRLRVASLLRTSNASIVLMAICPISVLVSGFHGNSDPVMVFFILLSVYLKERWGVDWASGLAFGMAVNIKVVPLLFVPTLFLYLKTWRARLYFFSSAALIILLLSLPYATQGPKEIIHATIGYTGTPAPWGFSTLFQSLGLLGNELAKSLLLVVILIAGGFLPILMRRRGIDLYTQMGVVTFLFLFLTPGLGVQYLSWGVAFILVLKEIWGLTFYISGGAFIFSLYSYWSRGAWYFADSHLNPAWNRLSAMLGFVCWGFILMVLIKYKDLIFKNPKPTLGL